MATSAGVVCATTGSGDHSAALSALELEPDVVLDLDARRTPSPEPPPQSATLVVSAATLTDLRRVLPTVDRLGSATRVVVLVLDQAASGLAVPRPGDVGAPLVTASAGAVPGSRGWRVDVRHAAPVPVARVVRAAAYEVSARPWRAALGLRVGLGPRVPAEWVSADPLARDVDTRPGSGDPATVDVLMTDTPTEGSSTDHTVPTVVVPAMTSWRELATATSPQLRRAALLDEHALPPVDEAVLNPIGFRSSGCEGRAVLTGAVDRSGWLVTRDGTELLRLPGNGRVTDAHVRALRGLDAVQVHWDGTAGPISAAWTVVQLAAAGIPLLSGPVPTWAQRLLGAPVVTALTSTTGWPAHDELRREEHSVRLRRAALTTHGSEVRWRQMADQQLLPVPPPQQISVVLATRRPELVPFAVDQVRRQRGVDLQLVLVVHGFSRTSPEVSQAVRDLPFPCEVLERPADEVFGDVLNAGLARCDGGAVAKMDDDDWYGPHHLADMAAAQRWSRSEATGSAADFVYLEALGITLRRGFASEVYADYVAGGTMVVDRAALLAAGGFRSVPRDVDAHLLRDLRAVGSRVFRTHGLGYVLRRGTTGHTWSADVTYFLRDRAEQWRGFRPSLELEPDPRHVPLRTVKESR